MAGGWDMLRRRLVKEISGRVFLDTSDDGVVNRPGQPLKGIKVRLYAAVKVEASGVMGSEVLVRREKLILSMKTDDAGEFRFLVREGAYSVCLDADTLPSGKCAIKTDWFCEAGKAVKAEFPVRDIASVPAGRRPGSTDFREDFMIGAVKMSSADRVRLARRLGLIDDHAWIEYLLHALYRRGKLPEEYRSRIPIKSGTGFVNDIRRYIERPDADPQAAESARQALAAPVPKLDKVYRSPGGYFNIHYTLSGENSAVMDYIEQVGRAFDNVKAFTCSSRGFREPILEDGRDSLDIYVFDQKGKYGLTYPSNTYNKGNSRARVASCFICIDNAYSPQKGFKKSREDCMRVTAAHEFFHAVQYAYNVDSDSWWKEASATWNEDEVYPGVNDYLNYVPDYLSAPYKPLDESSYSGVIFAKFLSENYGGNGMIKRIWETLSNGYDNSIGAIDRAIRESYGGLDLGTVFNRFSAYNINPAQYYKEGALWGTSASIQKTWSSYPVAENYGRLSHLSSNYLLFDTKDAAAESSIKITVNGSKGARSGFKVQCKKRKDKLYSMTEIASGGDSDRAVITIRNAGELYENVCLIPSNLEKERDGLKYRYSVDIE